MAKIFSSKGIWDNGIFLIRIVTAFFIYRHSRELFNIHDLISFLTDTKFPFPVFSGYAAKIIEFGGAILLALGLFTRFVTPLLIIVMGGVIYTINGGSIFDGEHPFLFALLFAVFFFIGPGKWSLDYLFFDKNRESDTLLKKL